MTNLNPQGNTIIRNVEESSATGEFERFENLTGKLLKVPKKELDEKREEEKRSKAS